PKPLVTVGGAPLIEHAVRQCAAAGARDIVVVTGHDAVRVEAVLPPVAESLNIRISARRTEDWSRPNGHSVLTGAATMQGHYLLVMADHMFAHGLLERLVHDATTDDAVTLAADRRTNHPSIDPDDATWVETDAKGRIRTIGKDIARFDAVDCGAFVAGPQLASGIRHAIERGRPGSLSDGMQVLADRGQAATIDIEDAWWIDVDDMRTRDIAERHLASRIEPPKGRAA
ncbi:MAG: NTP transferase domain-containing protein, partial [Pontixanthobacter sp.]